MSFEDSSETLALLRSRYALNQKRTMPSTG